MQRRMHLADFIQEDGAGIGRIELAEFLPVGAGEGALLIAKQLAFQQLVRDGGTIYFDERFLAAARLRVNHAGHHFFTGAAFAADEHGRRGVGHLLDGVLHFLHPAEPVPNRPAKSLLPRTWSRSSGNFG